MATVNLNIYTSAWPGVDTPVEIRVYKQSEPNAILVSHREANAHIEHTWSFPGLERTNLLFRIFQMTDMAANVIVQQLGGDENVVPSRSSGLDYKAPVLVQADFTAGFPSGFNTATFADWVGWEIATLERLGTGTMKKDIDYSWDKDTGVLTLLTAGDVFGAGEYFQVTFEAVSTSTADSVAAPQLLVGAKQITADYIVNVGTDFGPIILINPAGVYLEIQLPDITTVPSSKVINFEMKRVAQNVYKCAKFKFFTDGGTQNDFLDWGTGNRTDFYICPQESISFYKFVDVTDEDNPVNMWRVYNPHGHWGRVGETVKDDNSISTVFNKLLPDGSDGDVFALARFYNDFILNLPGGEVVNYDDWATGNNKYKWSLANSAIGGNAGKFKKADHRGVFERNITGARKPGDFEAATVLAHRHLTVVNSNRNDANFPYNRGAVLTKLKSMLYSWTFGGARAEGYYLDSEPTEPTLSRTSAPVDMANSNSFVSNENKSDNIGKRVYYLA
jgi:hypothetical protein